MPQITADKETFWRANMDEYGIVNLLKITQLTDDEGLVTEHQWRTAITPDDDVAQIAASNGWGAALTNRVNEIVAVARHPSNVARYEARKAAQTAEQ